MHFWLPRFDSWLGIQTRCRNASRRNPSRRKIRQRGHAAMEIALIGSWIFFLCAGALDMGFYAYSLIATQSAARVAAQYTSQASNTAADSTGACQMALDEMKSIHNVSGLSSCSAAPFQVTASAVTGVDGSPASSVSVTYQTDMLISIPYLMRQLAVTRTVQMRLRNP